MLNITKIEQKKGLKRKLNVCAYARVSNGKDAMLHSLAVQVSHYNEMIQSNNEWNYVGVYADEAISGTKDDRANFNRMIEDVKKGKIDLIITKSISRFARNTVTLLNTIRELKTLKVDVYFEEQKIHTISNDGELMLTILASYAQEEARSVSENMKWRVRKNFEEGKPWGYAPYGYKIDSGKFVMVPDEAKVVREIFDLYLSGVGTFKIRNYLEEKGYPTKRNTKWTDKVVRDMLKCYIYTGNVILQTTFRKDYICKRKTINNGERTKYHVEDAHDAIITMDEYNKVQEILRKRRESFNVGVTPDDYAFKGKLICSHCNAKYMMKKNYKTYRWLCGTYTKYGPKGCSNKQIPDAELQRLAKEILGVDKLSNEIINERIEKVIVCNNKLLIFYLTDGTKVERHWIEHSRSESWTSEMKEIARERGIRQHAKDNSNTTND